MKRSVIVHSISMALCFFLLGVCFVLKVSATEPEIVISRGVQLISEQRTKAETQISILEGLLAEQDINQMEYLSAKTKYSEAQGAFNGWIDRLLYDLRQGQELDASLDYQNTLTGAVEKGDAFVEEVRKLFLGEQQRGGEIGTFVSVFLKPLTDAGIAIWQEVKAHLATRHDRKEQLLKQVQGQLLPLKWKDFDEVSRTLAMRPNN